MEKIIGEILTILPYPLLVFAIANIG